MAQVTVIRCDRCNVQEQVAKENYIPASWVSVKVYEHTYDFCNECGPQVTRELRRKNTDTVSTLQREEAEELKSLRTRIANIERIAGFETDAYDNGKSSGVSLSKALKDILSNARR